MFFVISRVSLCIVPKACFFFFRRCLLDKSIYFMLVKEYISLWAVTCVYHFPECVSLNNLVALIQSM